MSKTVKGDVGDAPEPKRSSAWASRCQVLLIATLLTVSVETGKEVFHVQRTTAAAQIAEPQLATRQSKLVATYAPIMMTNETISNDEDDPIIQARNAAEQAWLGQSGYLWMQHSRKAGGTTLCMRLRLNQAGLIRTSRRQWEMPARETCQLCKFCCDCNLKNRYVVPKELSRAVQNAMSAYQRNFIEFEGNGVPNDLLEPKSSWSNWVFVGSIRDPLERIISSIQWDPKFNCKGSTRCTNNIVKQHVEQHSCRQGIYYCYSNYYVRMFSGLDTRYTSDLDMLQRAKDGFRRFSCVALLEDYQRTLGCLDNIGLHLESDASYNLKGKKGTKKKQAASETKLEMLRESAQETLRKANKVDIEFYEWARNEILASL